MSIEELEGNKLIAEIMEYETCTDPEHTNAKCYKVPFAKGYHRGHQLKFHSSWEWQIPVWSKVAHLLKELLPKLQNPEEKIKYYFHMLRLYEKAVFNSEPESGQKVIIDLIKFYNQHRQ